MSTNLPFILKISFSIIYILLIFHFSLNSRYVFKHNSFPSHEYFVKKEKIVKLMIFLLFFGIIYFSVLFRIFFTLSFIFAIPLGIICSVALIIFLPMVLNFLFYFI